MIAILLSTCTCLAFPAASMAAETDTASSQSISVTLTAEPEYTITIPESVSMGNDGTTVNVTASDVKNLPEGKKSYAVNFILQDESKTLNDKQIENVMNRLITNLKTKLGAELR